MLFHSVDFFLFFVFIFVLYWAIPIRYGVLKRTLIVITSYFFYGWWDWRFLSLILISTITDFLAALLISSTETSWKRRFYLIVSLVVNLGILSVFKYYNFFISSFSTLLSLFQYDPGWVTKHIVFPVGISFYTFQTIGYTVDVYSKKQTATKNFIAFAAFVSFFPQLVAGPIEKAKHLLPQFITFKKFDYLKAVDGLKLILWGSFKKIVVADNLGRFVAGYFNQYQYYSGIEIYFAIFLFAYQIYCDFSGYSDIAVGLAKLLNIDLSRNFRYPFFAYDVVNFWSRWHITLSAWFRDYVMIPIGGIRGTKLKVAFNIFFVFSLIGLWHGADWKFVFWGILNGVLVLPFYLNSHYRRFFKIKDDGRVFPSLKYLILMIVTSFITFTPLVFFRAASFNTALEMIHHGFLNPLPAGKVNVFPFIFVMMFLIPEWIKRKETHPLNMPTVPLVVRWMIYSVIILLMFTLGVKTLEPYIYYQF